MTKQILITMGVLLSAAALGAQSRPEYGAVYQFAGLAGTEGKVIGIESIGSQVVTGKPFSATEERHSVQVLGDGTRIENSETNRLFRDDQGRTRVERSGGNITVFDPVAGISAELDASGKTIGRTNIIVRDGRIVAKTSASYATTGDVLKSRLAKLREELSQMQTQYTDNYPQVVTLKKQIADLEKATPTSTGFTESTAAPDALKKAMEAQFSSQRFTVSNGVHLSVEPGNDAKVESLPSQLVNGALAQGTRTTETIPAGKIGNDRPINIVNERWFSSDLQMLVKSLSSDPRFGDTTYQLTNIVQAAPDPSLFRIPADYTIRK